jgi:hypothetical protein
MWEAGDSAARLRLAIAFLEHGPWRAWALADVLDRAPPFANAHLVLPTDSATMRTLLARRKPTEDIEYTEIVASLGEEALPILFELAKTATKHLHLSHTVAMTVFVTEGVARHLAACISHPTTRDLIGTYFEKHRELAAAVLPAASQGASRNAALAKALMIKVCGPPVEAESTVAMDDPLVPRILCDAPWRSPPPPLPDLGLDLDAYAVSVVLSEKRKAEGLAWLAKMQRGLPEMTPEEAAAYVTAHKEDRYFWYLVDNGKCIPLEIILDFFCAGTTSTCICRSSTDSACARSRACTRRRWSRSSRTTSCSGSMIRTSRSRSRLRSSTRAGRAFRGSSRIRGRRRSGSSRARTIQRSGAPPRSCSGDWPRRGTVM